MKNVNRQSTRPVKFPRSKRNHMIAKITSMDPGVCAPIAAIPLFREDGITGRKSSDGKWSSSKIGVTIEMAETKDLIMNKVRARITAYCVPWLAFERFGGSRDEFDKSYAGEQGLAGQVIPFIETDERDPDSAFYNTLGLHAEEGGEVNTMYLEAYNLIWNYRAKNRSPKIEPRLRLAETLAPAFWPAGRFEHLVPDFDAAVMDGQVALNVVAAALPVRGIGFVNANATVGPVNARETGGGIRAYPALHYTNTAANNIVVKASPGGTTSVPDIYAEMVENGITVSLSNIEMAKKAQSFAKLREQYAGFDDDYLIDTYMMNGVSLPDQAMKQPFLLADQTVTFRQAKRYATNSGHLDESAASGIAEGAITLRVPTLNVGGIVIVQVEILPDQLWERQKDPFLHSTSVADFPQALRDFTDPEKVDVVTNGEIDTDHDDPEGLLGYGPLNWKWTSFGPSIGGKYIKPQVGGATNLERMVFWAHEERNPALAESFYLCQGITKSIFLDENAHPFEVAAQGNVVIEGLTQFGGMLVEATENYEKVMEQVDQSRVKEQA